MLTDATSLPEPAPAAVPAPAINLRGHIPALDGLRGLAIVLVLICHFTEHMALPSRAGNLFVQLLALSRHGVDLFFVLSGFLITGILYDAKGSPRYFRNFYGRRTVRIFPLYYGVLIVVFGVLPFFRPFDTSELQQIWQTQWGLWLYCSNFVIAYHRDWWYVGQQVQLSHFWSLAVEEQFYLVWPFLILLLPRRGILTLCMFLIVGALATRFMLAWLHTKDLVIFVFTPCRLDALALGGLLAVLTRTPSLLQPLCRLARWTIPLCVVLMAGTLALGGRVDWIIPTFKYTFFAFIFGALLVLAITAPARTLLGRVFNGGFLRFMGKYSYGIYVFHGLLSIWMLDLFGPPLLLRFTHSYLLSYVLYVLLGSAFSVLVALISWNLFEKHFLKLKRFFA